MERQHDVTTLALVENEEIENTETGFIVATRGQEDDPLTDMTTDPSSVAVVQSPPKRNLCRTMLESAKTTWHSFNRDSKRAILAVMGLALLLSVVVIATISKSASIREPKSDNIWDEIRLPATVIPSHYDVKLKIDMTNERFTGSEDVLIDVVEATAVLLVHINSVNDEVEGDEMNVTERAVHKINEDGSVGGEIKVKHAFPYSKNGFYVMKMSQELEPGKYKISFEWESRLVRGLDGIYISTYKEGGADKKILASQMEPLAARKVMPCFDEPDFKATFSMEITAEKSYPLVLWNMPQEGNPETVEETWNKYTFEKSKKMSTYLLAFIVADFTCTTKLTTTNGVAVRTCGRKDPIGEGAGVYSADITKTIIEEYERFYGENFPLPKIDSVAVPDFSAGAMENWGLILYRETALLYNPEKDTYNNKARVNVVVAHELAHQWFGNLVTMKWWNDLWLNEGFASYVEWIGTHTSEPLWNYYDFQTYSDKSRAFEIDSYMSSRPTSIAVEKPDDITAQFDSISYSKGSALLVQAKMFMDGAATEGVTENFEDAIKSYIQLHKFNNTVQNDLYLELDKVYETKVDTSDDAVDIVEVMDTWTLQMNFPVLRVRQYDDNRIAISQNRFLISGSDVSGDKPSPYGYQWYVPVEYSVGEEATQFEWLKPYSTVLVNFDFSDADKYIHLNKESAGYYIVDYSYDLNSRLRAHLETKENYQKLSVSERQGMLYDTFLLVSSGAKPMSAGLELIGIMSTEGFEEKLIPLREISRQISRVAVHISGEGDLAKKWKKMFKDFATSLFVKFGKAHFKESGIEDALPADFQARMRATFAIQLACAYGNEACVNAATTKFNAYRDSDTALLPEFKSVILQTVMSREPVNEQIKLDWNFLWGRYLASDQATEKDVMYYALGLIQDEAVLINFSHLCLDPKLVRASDALYILGRSIARTRVGRVASWKFMRDNWDRLTQEFTDALFAVDAYIAGVLSNFADSKTLKEIEVFFSDKLDSLGPGRAAYESALQSIKGNIAWLDKHKSSVEDYVKGVVLLPVPDDPDN